MKHIILNSWSFLWVTICQFRQLLIKAITFFQLPGHYGDYLIRAGPKIKVFAEITWLISEEIKGLTFIKNIASKVVRCTACFTHIRKIYFFVHVSRWKDCDSQEMRSVN